MAEEPEDLALGAKVGWRRFSGTVGFDLERGVSPNPEPIVSVARHVWLVHASDVEHVVVHVVPLLRSVVPGGAP